MLFLFRMMNVVWAGDPVQNDNIYSELVFNSVQNDNICYELLFNSENSRMNQDIMDMVPQSTSFTSASTSTTADEDSFPFLKPEEKSLNACPNGVDFLENLTESLTNSSPTTENG